MANQNISRLLSILSIKRGHNSDGEKKMIDEVVQLHNPTEIVDDFDEVLAYYIQVGEGSRTLFSAHIDTVHGRAKKVIMPFGIDAPPVSHVNDFLFNPDTNFLHAKGDVLGADDGAGVWLLLEMIDAGVPGHYLLHRGEECGGIGSSGIAKHHGDFLQQFDRAIAFDRKGVHSVISHQGGSRCCSDMFASALADALSCDTYFFSQDEGGVFTDTANYTDHIGECTNVSVGYYNEHHDDEKLDLTYLLSLREKCIALKWEELPTKRMPGEIDPEDNYGWYRTSHKVPAALTIDDLYQMTYLGLVRFVEDDPDAAADMIWEMLYGNQPQDYFGSDLDETESNAGFDPKLDVGMR